MKWITREKVKVDRVACPWLIKKFIDPQAEFIFVPANQVEAKGCELGATPCDIEGCELGHQGDEGRRPAAVRLRPRGDGYTFGGGRDAMRQIHVPTALALVHLQDHAGIVGRMVEG